MVPKDWKSDVDATLFKTLFDISLGFRDLAENSKILKTVRIVLEIFTHY